MKKPRIKNLKHKLLLVLAASLLFLTSCPIYRTETAIKNRVVFLKGNNHSCTGEQVRAPSGVNYILTAAHCNILAVDGKIEVTSEYGTKLLRKVIYEDPKSDLLLLEGLPGLSGLNIAGSVYRNEEVRTFTHGAGFATYKTAGVLIEEKEIKIGISEINNSEQEEACKKSPKFTVVEVNFLGVALFKVCALDVKEMATTAMIVPGSSGGPVVDWRGNLVGVVSAGGEGFGFLVSLKDIQNFLSNY